MSADQLPQYPTTRSAQAWQMFQVGGSVRDALAGRRQADRDWCIIGLDHDSAIAEGFTSIVLHTVPGMRLYLHPVTREDCVLLQGSGSELSLITSNLCQRDFTINAMALAQDGSVIDPYGGQSDLRAGIVRHIESDSFRRDPIRLLRGARFCACWPQFRLAPETLKLFEHLAASEAVDHLCPERVWKELIKSLAASCPERFFMVLHSCGALAVVFPELAGWFSSSFAPAGLDAGAYTMQLLSRVSVITADPLVRFTALISRLPGSGPGRTGGSYLAERLRGPKSYRRIEGLAGYWYPRLAKILSPEDLYHLFEVTRAFHDPIFLKTLLTVSEADQQLIRAKPILPASTIMELLKQAKMVKPPTATAARVSSAGKGVWIKQQRLEAIRQALGWARPSSEGFPT